jgi:hypothetical protein
MSFLKDGQLVRVDNREGSSSLKVIATPGHTQDHGCFHLLEEDGFFTGDALSSSEVTGQETTLRPGHAVFNNLDQYLTSIQKLSKLFPKLIFPGHGDLIFQTLNYFSELEQVQKRIASSLYQLVSTHSGKISTNALIKLFFEQHKIVDSKEQFEMEGTLRLHLQNLEKKGLIKKVKGPMKDPYKTSENPDLLKGPGGLTMSQIFGKVQEAKRRDWDALNSRDKKRILETSKEALHPCHVGILGLPTSHTHWEKASL